MNNDHVHPIFQGILAAIAPASAASNNCPQTLSEASAEQWGERFMGSQAFQEGQDAALLGQSLNPYRRALRGLIGSPASYTPEAFPTFETLRELAQQWEDGYVSKAR